VLHTFPYRETERHRRGITAEYGRVAMVARGARRPRSELRGTVAGIPAAAAVVVGQAELKTLRARRMARRAAARRSDRRSSAAST
jgi:DNA repair protein RecO (recombination protein O)